MFKKPRKTISLVLIAAAVLTSSVALGAPKVLSLQKEEGEYRKGTKVQNGLVIMANTGDFPSTELTMSLKLKHLPTEWRPKPVKAHEQLDPADLKARLNVDAVYNARFKKLFGYRESDIQSARESYEESLEQSGRISSRYKLSFDQQVRADFYKQLMNSRELYGKLIQAIVACANSGDEEGLISLSSSNGRGLAMYHINAIECEGGFAKNLHQLLRQASAHDRFAPNAIKVMTNFSEAKNSPALSLEGTCIATTDFLYDNYGIRNACCTASDECTVQVEFVAKMPK